MGGGQGPVKVIHWQVLSKEAGRAQRSADRIQQAAAWQVGEWIRQVNGRPEIAVGGYDRIGALAEAERRTPLVLS